MAAEILQKIPNILQGGQAIGYTTDLLTLHAQQGIDFPAAACLGALAIVALTLTIAV